MFWRWLAFFSAVTNIVFNYLYQSLPISGQSISLITNKYNSLFTPAGYAFSIWGVIYLSFIIYGIYQLLPSQKADRAYDRIAIPFMLTNLLSMAWITLYSNDRIGGSVIIITGMLLFGGIMFAKAKEAYLYERYSFWITVPFSLFLGWISVAAIANTSLLLISMNYRGGDILSATTWTCMMIGVAFLLAIVFSIVFRDFIYPAVVSWACIAIWVSNNGIHSSVASFALYSGIALALWSVIYAVQHYKTLSMHKYNAGADA